MIGNGECFARRILSYSAEFDMASVLIKYRKPKTLEYAHDLLTV